MSWTSSLWGFFTCAFLDVLFADFVGRAVAVPHTSSSTKHRLNNGVQAMLLTSYSIELNSTIL